MFPLGGGWGVGRVGGKNDTNETPKAANMMFGAGTYFEAASSHSVLGPTN